MTRLSQIIAVEKGVKSDTTRQLTDLHRKAQSAPLLTGIARTYQPRAEDGDPLPPESTKVQVSAEETLRQAATLLTRLWDVTYTKDVTNAAAAADIVVGGRILLRSVPVTYLLFLEKQLTDLHTFISKLPSLDPAEDWSEEGAPAGCWRSAATETVRPKKVPRNHVLAEATKEHPAQVQVYMEDVPVGDWTTVKFSGAMPARRIRELLDRVAELQHAVKYAREEANSTEVTDRHAGEPLLAWLLRE